jgi:hypothetical protein
MPRPEPEIVGEASPEETLAGPKPRSELLNARICPRIRILQSRLGLADAHPSIALLRCSFDSVSDKYCKPRMQFGCRRTRAYEHTSPLYAGLKIRCSWWMEPATPTPRDNVTVIVRRTHTKSRKGCINCKRRKVKVRCQRYLSPRWVPVG